LKKKEKNSKIIFFEKKNVKKLGASDSLNLNISEFQQE